MGEVSKMIKDMIASDGNGKTSSKKVIFLLTWLVASGVIVNMACSSSLSFEIFTAYLLFGMGSDVFAKLIALRFGGAGYSGADSKRVDG